MNSSKPMMKWTSSPLDSYRALLSTETYNIVAVFAVLGVFFHVTILRTVEIERFVYRLVTLGFITVVGLCAAHIQINFSPVAAILRVALLSFSFSGALFLSMMVYRVFFHPLRKFPGPVGAKISRFYVAYKASQDLQYHKQVSKWHEQYGDFVRTGKQHPVLVSEMLGSG